MGGEGFGSPRFSMNLIERKVPDHLMKKFRRYVDEEGMGLFQAIRRILEEEKNGSDGVSKGAEEAPKS
jgi:hypothetical protein